MASRPWTLSSLSGHDGRVLCCSISPDLSMAATASDDRSVRIWTTANSACVRVLTGHGMRVNSVSWSPDGTVLASASHDATIRLWDPKTGDCLAVVEGHTQAVNAVCYSPDGMLFASCSDDGTVALWDAENNEILSQLTGHTNRVVHCAFSPDGARLASSSYDNTVKIWSVATGELQRSIDEHKNWVLCAVFSPNDQGARLATASWDNSVKVWDLNTGSCLRSIRHGSTVNACAFSADGTRLVSACYDASLKVWDVATALNVFSLTGHTGAVNSVVYLPDGSIVSAADDTTVRTWGYPPLYRWLAGLQLEAFHSDLAAKLGGANSPSGSVPLEKLEDLTEVDLVEMGMNAAQSTRFSDYLLRLADDGFKLPPVDPQEELRVFVGGFIGPQGAKILIDRLRLVTVEDLGGFTVEQLVAAGLAQEMAEMVLNAAEQAGFGELNRSRRTEEKRRAAEQDRLAGVVLRSSPDGVHAALLALQKAGAPPTATGFFISHSKAEGELTAEQLGDDLIAMSEDILGHSVDEVWCGHQVFPTDAETEAAMLNGVRGCTCFVLLLTRSTLTRPYVHLELRAAMTVRKPIVVVHDPDDRNGGADLEAIIDSAPEDIQVLFDTAKVVQLRHKPEERRLMIREVFTQAKAQGACFHAMISISSHASLLAEVAELRQLLVEEKERVADLGQNTLITEINMLKAELEQETAMNAAERKRHEDLSGKVKKLQNEAKVWEKNLQRALEREHVAKKQVDTLTETIEELQREAAVRERMLEANLSEMNADVLRLSSAMADGAMSEKEKKRRAIVHKVCQYALAGLFQSVAGGETAEPQTLLSFLEYISFSAEEAQELVSSIPKNADGNVEALGWTGLADDILGPSRNAKTAAREQLLAASGIDPGDASRAVTPLVLPGSGNSEDPELEVRSLAAQAETPVLGSPRARSGPGLITDPDPDDDDN